MPIICCHRKLEQGPEGVTNPLFEAQCRSRGMDSAPQSLQYPSHPAYASPPSTGPPSLNTPSPSTPTHAPTTDPPAHTHTLPTAPYSAPQASNPLSVRGPPLLVGSPFAQTPPGAPLGPPLLGDPTQGNKGGDHVIDIPPLPAPAPPSTAAAEAGSVAAAASVPARRGSSLLRFFPGGPGSGKVQPNEEQPQVNSSPEHIMCLPFMLRL